MRGARRARLRDALGVLLVTSLLWLGLEAALRALYALRNAAVGVVVLPYSAAQDWGPLPPWLDGLRILEPDPVLLWRNRRGVERTYLDVYGPVARERDRQALLQRFWPSLPPALRGRPTWKVSLGEHGFRTPLFDERKPDRRRRIVCLGDSWTFGANVDQAQAYPQQLAARLAEAGDGSDVEVLNLGVMGYSSRQGLELLRRRVLDMSPDVVVVAFAMNDAVVAGWHDADAVAVEGGAPTRSWLDRSELLRLARYLVKRATHEPWTIGDYLARVSEAAGSPDELWTGRQAAQFADEAALARLARVPPEAYEANLREMTQRVRSVGGEVLLLYNELWDTPYRAAMRRVASEAGVGWVDAFALLSTARERHEAQLAAEHGLVSAGTPSPGMVLRVHQGPHEVPDALYVTGTHRELGAGLPNRVALRDDGRGGDERADDGIWSLAVAIEPGERVFYVYTNSGREGHWEGLDVPDLRHLVASSGYRPIERFGTFTLQADGWHTDAEGHALIAEAVHAALPAQ